MAIVYQKCDAEVGEMAREVMRKHHPHLIECDVRIAYLFASEVNVHGFPCAAKVKVVPAIQRADGRADVEMVIDQTEWEKATESEREALLDHELTHVGLKGGVAVSKTGEERFVVESDDLGRPKIKLRKHDFQVGWFHEIADRHGDASYEVRQAKAFADEHGQTYFGWAAPPAGGVESMPAKMPKPNGKMNLDSLSDPLAAWLRKNNLGTVVAVLAKADGDASLVNLKGLGLSAAQVDELRAAMGGAA